MSFQAYDTSDYVISSDTVVAGAWFSGSVNTNVLSTFYTSSYSEYYTNIYAISPVTTPSASVQFSIQYGHVSGSGSAYINSSVPGNSPSRVVYGEYRNLIYGESQQNFSINGSASLQDIYVVNIARSSYKESLYPGSLSLILSSSATSVTLTDDSNYYTDTRFIGENMYFNLIVANNPSSVVGLVFPNLDLIIISPLDLYNIVGTNFSLPNRSANTVTYNANKIFTWLTSFSLQSSETISSTYFFTRVKNSEFNYTTNPSITDSNGNIIYNTLVNNPQTFITTVGLYNNNNELLAVAKLSQPLTKDFTKEALIRVKMVY
jgi:hypothetical protein